MASSVVGMIAGGNDPCRRNGFRRRLGLIAAAVVVLCPVANAGPPVTSPKEFLGFNLGDDYCLANYQELMAYWSKLERESDRVKVVRIGITEEGWP